MARKRKASRRTAKVKGVGMVHRAVKVKGYRRKANSVKSYYRRNRRKGK